jgi:hypothetical protein
VLTRAQAIIFVAVFAAAIILEALFARMRPRLRAFWPVWTTVAAGIAVAIATPGILGAYSVTVGGSYPVGAGLRLTYDHLAFFALSTAIAPFAALVYLLVEALRGREPDPRARAIIAVTTCAVVLVTAQVGFFAARFAPHLLGRDLAALPPLLFLTFALWLSKHRARSRTRLLAAFAVLALIATVPWGSLAGESALPDSFGIALLLRWHWLAPDNLALVAALVALALFAAAPRRAFLLLPALMGALLIATSTVAANEIDSQVSAAQTNIVGSPPNWIDRATTSSVAYLYNGETYWNSVWQEVFWNPRIQDILTVWPSVVTGPLAQTSVTVPATGRLPTTDRYIVASDRNELDGTPVAHLTQTGLDVSGLTLWRLNEPARLSLVKTNIAANGDITTPAGITVYDCTKGTLQLTLVPKATRVVRVTLNGRLVLRKSLVGLSSWQATIPVPLSVAPRECVFTITGQDLLGSTTIEFQR